MRQILWIPAAVMSIALAPLPGMTWRALDAAPSSAALLDAPTLTVTPATATIEQGRSLRLSSVVTDQWGRQVKRTVVWSSGDPAVASVAADGQVRGLSVGTTTITGSALSGRAVGTARITVIASTTTTTPTTPTSAVAVFGEGFESGSLGSFNDGYDASRHRVITDATLARSGSRLLEVTYPDGGNAGFLTRFFMPGYDSVHVSYWVRFPATWKGSTLLVGLYGSRLDNQWSAYGKAGRKPTGTDFMVSFLANVAGNAPGTTAFSTYHAEMLASPDGKYWGDAGFGRASYQDPRVMTLGAWHRVELWVKLNTPGQKNGVQRFWLDGVLKGEWTGLRFRDTDQIRINSVQLPFAGTGTLAGQKLYIDDLQVTGNAVSGSSGPVTEPPPPPPPPPTPAPVASVTISPTSVQLLVDSARTFEAVARDADGTVLTGRTVTWSTSAPAIATVTSTGTVRGLAPGTATITATSEGRSATGAITVVAPQPPPPPPPPPSTALFSDDFESGSLAGWQDGYSATHHRVITDATLARSGSRLLEVSYLQGGHGGFLTRFFMPGHDSVRVSYWVRFPATWQGSTKLVGLYASRVDNQWSAFGKAGQRPNGTDFAIAFLSNEPGPAPGVTHFYTYFPEMLRHPDGVYWGDNGIGRAAYNGSRVMTLGTWHHVELWVKLNTPGQSNGVQRFWIDGVLQGEWSNLRFRDTDQIRLNSVQLTFDRSGSPALPAQKLYIDDLRIVANAPSGSEGPVTPPPPPPQPAPVASVGVTPSAATIVAGSGTQFSATLRDAAGNVLTGRAVSWTSSNAGVATVSSSGAVAGVAAGSTTIRATSEGQVGQATLTVTAPAPVSVATVAVAPSSVSLAVGQTQTLAATTRSATGSILTGRTVTWTSTNTAVATVSSSGTVSALGAGSATIRATSEGITGSAAVSVAAPPPPPPPPSGSLAFTNAPSGLTIATSTDWTSWPSGWVNERASTVGLARLATDATAPVSASGVLEEAFLTGMPGGTAPGNVIFHGTNGATEVFAGFWFKMSPNFEGHSSGVNKLVNLWTPTDIHWLRVNSYREYDNDGSRQNGPYYLVATNRSSPYDLLQNQVPAMIPIVPGQWHKIEWHLTTPAAGPGNGRIRWWLDGVLLGEYSNLASTMSTQFWEFQISPTWGGVGGTTTRDSFMRFDNMFISRR